MFEIEVWVAIIVTLLTAFLSIRVIGLLSVKVQDGKNIKTPTLNVASIFLNGGQIKVPLGSFARFLLVLFIIWSLIIRTCYQSILFEHLQADMRKPTYTTVAEFKDAGFSFSTETARASEMKLGLKY